jgi:hypothetical protein
MPWTAKVTFTYPSICPYLCLLHIFALKFDVEIVSISYAKKDIYVVFAVAA